jgi:hypothetical protein
MYAEGAFPVLIEEVASVDSIYNILWIVEQITNKKLRLVTRIAHGMGGFESWKVWWGGRCACAVRNCALFESVPRYFACVCIDILLSLMPFKTPYSFLIVLVGMMETATTLIYFQLDKISACSILLPKKEVVVALYFVYDIVLLIYTIKFEACVYSEFAAPGEQRVVFHPMLRECGGSDQIIL